MGNQVTVERMKEYQHQILSTLTGLDFEQDIVLQDVIIDEEKKYYMHTIIIDRKNDQQKEPKDTIVLLHGYGGSGTCFYRIFKEISEKYRLILVDLLGQGQSSRPEGLKEMFIDNVDASENFFVDSLEKWREQMNLSNFILSGHSMGGLVAACYAIKHQQHVKKLLLLSPAGFGKQPDDFDVNTYVLKFGGYVRQKVALWFCEYWTNNNSVMDALRKMGYHLTSKIADDYQANRMPNLPVEHREVLKHYILQIFLQPGSSEYAANTLLLIGGYARKPLMDRLNNLNNLPITFMFGDKDWMHQHGACEVRDQRLPEHALVKITIIEDCAHQMHFENPEAVVKAVLNDLLQDEHTDIQN